MSERVHYEVMDDAAHVLILAAPTTATRSAGSW